MIDSERLPDVRPDRRKFWLMRGMVGLLFISGIGLAVFGGGLGALAYYGTKNGAEAVRALGALPQAALAVVVGLVLMTLSQALRVLLAIEENTRMTAYNTRVRVRAVEAQRAASTESAAMQVTASVPEQRSA